MLKQHVTTILRPFVRFCFRHQIKLNDIIEACKQLYIETAIEHLNINNQAVSNSKISLMTGVHRKDIAIMRTETIRRRPYQDPLAKIIGLWRTHKRFTTSSHKPKVLNISGADSEFGKLVGLVSKEINPYTALGEFERIGAVTITKNGAKLVARVFMPAEDLRRGLDIATEDVDDLFQVVEYNTSGSLSPTNRQLHLRTEYDNIPASRREEIRNWILAEGSLLHEKIRRHLGQLDRDISEISDDSSGTICVSVGAFSFIKEVK